MKIVIILFLLGVDAYAGQAETLKDLTAQAVNRFRREMVEKGTKEPVPEAMNLNRLPTELREYLDRFSPQFPKKIALGPSHCLILTKDGTLWGSGSNKHKELSNFPDGKDFYPDPVRIPVLQHSPIRDVVAGSDFSAALHDDGTVSFWGEFRPLSWGELRPVRSYPAIQQSNEPQVLPEFQRIVALAAGDRHLLALHEDGTVWGWGSNESGQAGSPPNWRFVITPTQIPQLSNVAKIYADHDSSLALLRDGTVFAWGDNRNGNLGVEETFVFSPSRVSTLENVIEVAFSSTHTLALKNDGTVMAWGLNMGGSLGVTGNQPYPVEVHGLNHVAQLASGSAHTIVLLQDGTVQVMGSNDLGDLGLGLESRNIRTHIPLDLPNMTDIISVYSRNGMSFAVTRFGTIYRWGKNWYPYFHQLQKTTPHEIILE